MDPRIPGYAPPPPPSEEVSYPAYSPSPSSIDAHRTRPQRIANWTRNVGAGALSPTFGKNAGVGSAAWSDTNQGSVREPPLASPPANRRNSKRFSMPLPPQMPPPTGPLPATPTSARSRAPPVAYLASPVHQAAAAADQSGANGSAAAAAGGRADKRVSLPHPQPMRGPSDREQYLDQALHMPLDIITELAPPGFGKQTRPAGQEALPPSKSNGKVANLLARVKSTGRSPPNPPQDANPAQANVNAEGASGSGSNDNPFRGQSAQSRVRPGAHPPPVAVEVETPRRGRLRSASAGSRPGTGSPPIHLGNDIRPGALVPLNLLPAGHAGSYPLNGDTLHSAPPVSMHNRDALGAPPSRMASRNARSRPVSPAPDGNHLAPPRSPVKAASTERLAERFGNPAVGRSVDSFETPAKRMSRLRMSMGWLRPRHDGEADQR
jgi:hypothetical protein